MSEDNVNRILKKCVKNANISLSEFPEKTHSHMLRHSRAMHMYEDNIPFIDIQQILGHVDSKTTLIYANASTRRKREMMEKNYLSFPEFEENVNKTSKWSGIEEIIKRHT